MVPLDKFLAFGAVALVIIIIPGPSVLFTVGRALAYGRRTAVLTVVGNTTGAFTQAMLVCFGLGTLVERSDLLFWVLKLAGSGYLVYLGAAAFRERRKLSDVVDAALGGRPEQISTLRILRDGYVVGIANPKVLVLFGAILPQFVDRSAGHVQLQMVQMTLLFSTLALLSDCVWGVLAGTARDWFAKSPRRLAMVGGAGGLAMIGVGAAMAFTGGRKN